MRRIERASSHLVFDDVLDAEEFEAVGEYMRLESFFEVHDALDGYQRVFTPADGRPLRGPVAMAHLRNSTSPPAEEGVHAYPTGAAIDRVMKRIMGAARRYEELIGKKGSDWDRLVARAWLYPPDTSLGWHNDKNCVGAFAYYVHPTWSLDWGGELLVLDTPTGRSNRKVAATQGHDIPASALRTLWAAPDGPGGRFISARPNRLVVLAAGTAHRIAPVSSLAGHHLRATISGFFLAPHSG